MLSYKKIAMLIAVPAIAVLGTAAVPFMPAPAGFPPVGLASSETAQVNVLNTAQANGSTAASCSGSISFYNAEGTVIGSAATFNNLATGQIFSATLPYSASGGNGSRTVIRVEIARAQSVTGAAVPPCNFTSSLETFDTATGVTHVVISGPAFVSVSGIHTLPAQIVR